MPKTPHAGRFDHCLEDAKELLRHVLTSESAEARASIIQLLGTAQVLDTGDCRAAALDLMDAGHGEALPPDTYLLLSVLRTGRTPDGSAPSTDVWTDLMLHPSTEVRLEAQMQMGKADVAASPTKATPSRPSRGGSGTTEREPGFWSRMLWPLRSRQRPRADRSCAWRHF